MSYWPHIEHAFASLDVHREPHEVLKSWRGIAFWVKDLLAVHWAMSEIGNGGFLQWFMNPSSVLAPEAAAGLKAMGLAEAASVVERAMGLLGRDYPREQATRDLELQRLTGHSIDEPGWDPFLSSPFLGLEDELYQIAGEDLGRIYDAMDHYARRHTSGSG